jgi:hypothetical protein
MNTGQLMAIGIGGTTIAILGGIAEYLKEKEMPRAKGIMRDFIIGAIMTLLLFQLLPDSMSDLTHSLSSMSNVVSSVGGGLGGAEPELQVGVPSF